MSAYDSLIAEKRRRNAEVERYDIGRLKSRDAFMSDPGKLDKLTAAMVADVSPSSAAPKKSKFSSLTAAYDSTIPEDHPFAGFGNELKGQLQKVLSDRRTAGMDPSQVAGYLTQRLMLSSREKGGPTRLEEAFHYKRMEEGKLWGGEKVKLPATVPISYDDWLSEKRKMEKESFKGDDWFADAGDLSIAAGAGATVGGVIGAVSTGGLGALPMAAITGVSTAIGEVVAHPLRKMLNESEWYQSKQELDSTWYPKTWEEAKGSAVKFAPDILLGGGIDNLLVKAFSVPAKSAAKIAANGSSRVIMEEAAKVKAAWKPLKEDYAVGRLVNKIFAPGEKTIGVNEKHWLGKIVKDATTDKKSRDILERFGKEIESYTARAVKESPETLKNAIPSGYPWFSMDSLPRNTRAMFNSLDDEGKVAALGSSDGPAVGVLREFEKKNAKMVAENEAFAKKSAKGVKAKDIKQKVEASKSQGLVGKAISKADEGIEEAVVKKAVKENRAVDSSGVVAKETAAVELKVGDTSIELTDNIINQYGKKARGKGFDEVRELKPWNKLSKQEKIQEVKNYLSEDILKAKGEAGDNFEYFIDRALDPLDPANEFYAEVLRRNGYEAVAGKSVKEAAAPVVDKAADKTLIQTAKQTDEQVLDSVGSTVPKDVPYVESPFDDTPLTGFRIRPGEHDTPAKFEWDVEVGVARRNHRDISIDKDGNTQIAPGKWKGGLETQKIEGYIVEGYDPVKKEWVWLNTTDDLPDAESSLAVFNNMLADQSKSKAPLTMIKGGKNNKSSLTKSTRATRAQEAEEILPAAEGEAVKTPVTKAGGKKKRTSTTTETIETVDGPYPIEYAPRKGVTKEKAKEAAVKKAHELAEQRVREAKINEFAKESPETLNDFGATIAQDFQAGKIPIEEAIDKMEMFGSAIARTPNIANEAARGMYLEPFDSALVLLRKVAAEKKFAGLFGTGAAFYTFFSGEDNEAQASMASEIAKGVVRGGKAAVGLSDNFLSHAKKARYIVDTFVPDTKYVLGPEEYQVGLRGSKEFGAPAIVSNFNDWAGAGKGKSSTFRSRYMSPGMVFDELTNVGKGKFNSPAAHRASFQASEYVNVSKVNKAFNNIIRDAGIKSDFKKIREEMAPVTKLLKGHLDSEFVMGRVSDLEAKITKLKGKDMSTPMAAADLERFSAELAAHKEMIPSLKNATKEYHAAWEQSASKLAHESSSARVFLALGDTPDFKKYPFLRNVKFSPEEKIAIGRVRQQMQVYKVRLEDIGKETISGPYAPHFMHPDISVRKMLDLAGGNSDKAGAYMRIYKRSFDSRPLIPDLEFSMRKYFTDTEKRIQNIDFWDRQGWKKVMHMSEEISPAIHDAFKNIYKGMAPIEDTMSNRFSKRYTEFETLRLLFLNPSASLKHLVKVTGTIAEMGPRRAMEALPTAIKLAKGRLTDNTPVIKDMLLKMGVKESEHGNIVQQYFNSIVPLMSARHRMLDVGLSSPDEILREAKTVWGRAQDLGGSLINAAEIFDRAMTVTSSMIAAGKQGMTAEQAMYAAFDPLLRNNFLYRELNAPWMQNPKFKMLFMFQGTPYKILERRVVNAVRSERALTKMGKAIKEATKTAEGRRLFLRDLRNLRSDIKAGEHAFKGNMLADALMSETDVFGTSVVKQTLRDALLVAAGTYGGAAAGVNLHHHFFHIPFLSTQSKGFELSVNPGINAINRGVNAWKEREDSDDEFVTTKILQQWFGKGGRDLLPSMIKKSIRLSNNDIPEIYKDSKFKYIFALPSLEKD